MSRHYYTPSADTDYPYKIVVGWDPPLGTFFAQVFDVRKDEDHPVSWLGIKKFQIINPQVLSAGLEAMGYPPIPEALQEKLKRDMYGEGYQPPPEVIQRFLDSVEEERNKQ